MPGWSDLPPLITMEAAIKMGGVSRTRLYALIASGDIKTVRFRGKRLIKMETLKPHIAEKVLVKRADNARPDSLAYSIENACRLSSLGRTTIFKLIEEGKLETVKVGNRRLVKGASLRNILEHGA